MRTVSSSVPARAAKVVTSKVATSDVAHVSRRAVSPFVATYLIGMAAGPSCRQSASRGERQEYLKSARKPVALLGNLTRSRRRLQPQSLKTKTLSVDTMTRRRKWPISCHFVPFSAISGHFVKKIYTSPDNLFCFHHFRQAVATDIPACRFAKHNAGQAGAARVNKRLPWRAQMPAQVIFRM